MTALPAHVQPHDRQVGGVECSPAPKKSPIHVLGLGTLAMALGAMPGRVLRWLSEHTNHIRLEKES